MRFTKRIVFETYRLNLPAEFSSVLDTFHVFNLKKCLADASLHVPLDESKVDKLFALSRNLLRIWIEMLRG